MQELRRWIALCESESYRVYHGSPYPDIREFRLKGLRHRTGTPGTLSFTTNIETAKIYGKYIYEVQADGEFGDYLDPEDVAKAYAFRWPEYRDWVAPRFPPDQRDAAIERTAVKLRKEIAEGRYEKWECVPLWRAMGWDGAWCHESDGRNLLVGNLDCLRLIGQVGLDNQIA